MPMVKPKANFHFGDNKVFAIRDTTYCILAKSVSSMQFGIQELRQKLAGRDLLRRTEGVSQSVGVDFQGLGMKIRI